MFSPIGVQKWSMDIAPLKFSDCLIEFESAFFALPQSFAPRKVNDHLYFFGPHDGEAIDLCISCLVHGNELGGLVATTELFKLLKNNNISFNKRVAIVVGNPAAAEAGVRYVDKDLNRCFGGRSIDTKEECIARLLEPFLAETKFIIDLHQTKNSTLSDFFIFPQSENNIRFAWHLGKDIPIVVHENQFSVDGMCLDSFVTLSGGVGVTYEMGQLDSTSLQIHKTLRLLSRALSLLNSNFPLDAQLPSSVFVFDQVVMSKPGLELTPKWNNFTVVKEGDILAISESIEIRAEFSGHLLFPKYPPESQQNSELCRLIRSVPLTDIFERDSIYSAEI